MDTYLMIGPGAKPCPVCRRRFVAPATGRPKSFCSDGCRRLRDHEVRRVDRRLAKLEDEMDALRVAPLRFRPGTTYRRREVTERAARRKTFEAEIRRLSTRLRTLLDYGAEPSAEPTSRLHTGGGEAGSRSQASPGRSGRPFTTKSTSEESPG